MKPDIAARLKGLTQPTGTEDLMRVNYPTPRFQISLKHAIIVCIIVMVALAGWFLSRDKPAAPPTMAALAETYQTPAPSSKLVVSVVGHVSKPGLVTLAEGSRVADALGVAGALPDADLTALNLAQVLIDGTQIHVLAIGEAPPQEAHGEPSGSSSGLISLNTATLADLVSLPGVGEKTAQTILDFRDTNGGFSSVEDLLQVKGIGPSKFEQLSPLVVP
ncbi:ComEA family DNA-binding protein [Corynebacterium crudilactis]|uniref:Transporter n=1 Tax=Corynebacterium crudilactis TaxID=1652495 RepID=A0A172QVA5_9CORY|nr:ComEA family DNA-binding protein [Corynebacterium crudilactis]ANE04578.1 transporter [Corynebacterium crudilactis]